MSLEEGVADLYETEILVVQIVPAWAADAAAGRAIDDPSRNQDLLRPKCSVSNNNRVNTHRCPW